MRSKIHVVEGVTCSGKSTTVKDILLVLGENAGLIEHPPRHEWSSDWKEHQRQVFDEYYSRFWDAEGEFYADFSPFACIPFCLAIEAHYGIDMSDLVGEMLDACNLLCQRHLIYLHRYFKVGLDTVLSRLATRQRKGDDTWDAGFLAELIKQYDIYFTQTIELRNYRIIHAGTITRSGR